MMAKVENAIILAAGMGSRMAPLTYNCPKGLIEVRGESLIERQICQLLEKGIRDIIIVTGYQKEAFDVLKKKYEGNVTLLHNPYYEKKNNISSMYLAREYLKNTYILSSDNYYTENIFNSEESESWYCAITDGIPRQEWGLDLDEFGKIVAIHKTAEVNQPFMYGAVYFNRAFSEKFRLILEKEYADLATHGFLWEEILKKHLAELEIKARLESKTVVYEIESFEELRAFDGKYRKASGNFLIELISKFFQVGEEEITNIQPQKMGLTNDSFVFCIRGRHYIFRLPGKGSEQFIDRKKEAFVYEKLRKMKVTDRVIYLDAETGIKISFYEEKSRHIHINDTVQLKKAIQILKRIHQSGIVVEEKFGIETCKKYEEINHEHPEFFERYIENRKKIEELENFWKTQGMKQVLCHTDFIQENILCLQDGEVCLIDWEYSGMSEPMVDLAIFVICGWYPEERLLELARDYFEDELSVLEYFRVYFGAALSAITWAAWARTKEYQGYRFDCVNYAEKIYSYVEPCIKKAEYWMERLKDEKRNK